MRRLNLAAASSDDVASMATSVANPNMPPSNLQEPLAGINPIEVTATTPTTATSAAETTPTAKPQRKYERKSKRFVWPDELHRLFVAAIFDLGLKNASPKALMPFMGGSAGQYGLTTEHLKSHLQKYRLNYERSRAEFLEFYDETAKRNVKRRRRTSKTSPTTEQQSMFVFPIRAHQPSADGSVQSTSNADDDDEEEYDEEKERGYQSDSETDHTESSRRVRPERSQGRGTQPPAPAPNVSYQQMLQGDLYAATGRTRKNSERSEAPTPAHAPMNPADVAAHYSRLNLAATKPVANLTDFAQQYAASINAGAYPYTNRGMYDNPAMAAAAAAAAAANGAPLSDPQWSILASLLSPQLSAVSAQAHALASQRKTSLDAFSLEAEPTDLQLQMHLAMQAQMNLHRQMLTRKVAVSQHLANGQQQPRDQAGQDRDIGHYPPILSDPSYQQLLAGQQGMGQSEQMLLRQQLFRAAQLQIQQQNAMASLQHHMPHGVAASTNTGSMPSTPSTHPTAASAGSASTTPAVSSSTADNRSLPSDQAASVPNPTALSLYQPTQDIPATSPKPLDSALDSYRWDQMDLQMSMSDDEGDLFSFLRS
ncbi:hypothetical protein Poli38472_001570 [Pythium oligandrum]|uniref:Uncharacterized protein n=1 Tax=Pythium oligandrum TaxID=41045 RepID=A0A8K1CTT2_PYTOL|nr:hypothetical protein Poli38472_001570 [Pythium oligandrum]|eukprot:TMW69414.1 hypothetical protein Poli38472_001570 [Pythium oligandrum]